MLYIILPVHNRKAITEKLVRCLQQQTYKNFHLLLVDDGSTDGTAEMVTSLLSDVTVLRGTGSWWWAGSLHQAYLWLKQQRLPENAAVVILNDDVVFDELYLEKGLNALQKHERTLVASIGISSESGKQIDGGIYMDWKHWKSFVVQEPERINCTSTRGLFMRADDFVALGGFYPKLLPHYTSDYEFTMRALRRGYKIHVESELVLSFSEKTSGIYNFYAETSYIVFLRKLFSKKYTLQPFYLTMYVALACPWKWKFLNWLRIWGSTFWKLVKYFFIIMTNKFKKPTTEAK